jgi:branched-chain amino acid aminotransferase
MQPRFGDHELRDLGPMVVMATHHQGRGWSPPALTARDELRVSVAAGAVQHGLSVFEGLKAHRGQDGNVAIFRPAAHATRLRMGAARLGLPDPGEALFLQAVTMAVRAHEPLVPRAGGGALYLRPTLMAFDEALELRPARRHVLCVVAAQAAPPATAAQTLWVDDELVRAAPGGLLAAKTAANYAATLFGRERARRHGCDDALWLDGCWRRDVTEAGTTNVFALIDDTLVTPGLDGGHVLPGVTRDSCLALARAWQLPAEERLLSWSELQAAAARGRLREVFVVGTASGVVSIGEIGHSGGRLVPPETDLAQRLRGHLAAVHEARTDDALGWLSPVSGDKGWHSMAR